MPNCRPSEWMKTTTCVDVDVWILGAKHEMDVRHSMPAARGLLQQAIATNPHSQQLWIEVGCSW